MDKLKKYLQEHADEMDFENPSDAVWQKIEAKLPQEKSGKVINLKAILWAAAACAAIFVGIFLFSIKDDKNTIIADSSNNSRKNVITSQNPQTAPIHDTIFVERPTKNANNAIAKLKKSNFQTRSKSAQRHFIKAQTVDSALLAEESGFEALFSFASIVDKQKEEISKIPILGENPSAYDVFKLELNRLNADEKKLQQSILKNGMNDKAFDQLILIYQQKISLLKKLRNEVNKTNSRFLQSRPLKEAAKSQIHYLNL